MSYEKSPHVYPPLFFFNNDGIPFKAYTDLVGRRIVISNVPLSIAYKGNSREVTKDTKEII